jgi:hypothetical protein
VSPNNLYHKDVRNWNGIGMGMGSGPRKYTEQTLKKLFGLSGNQCSFPGCTKRLVNENNARDVNICHIEGANPKSERYRSDMLDKERADYENLILLCIQHHDETNDVEKYTFDVLQRMKREHVSDQLHEKISRNPSMLRNTVNAIANIDIEDNIEGEKVDAFDISSKINHNNVKKYAPLIQEYKVYYYKINALYDELELQGSLKKSKVLSTIRSYYLKAKGEHINATEDTIEQIRKYADDIINHVVNNLYRKLEGCDLFDDDIMFGVELIMVDAFMRCKILEEPK